MVHEWYSDPAIVSEPLINFGWKVDQSFNCQISEKRVDKFLKIAAIVPDWMTQNQVSHFSARSLAIAFDEFKLRWPSDAIV